MTQEDLAQSLPKLYIVVRDDLPPGAQACQGMHALREFVDRYPEEEARWYKESNTLAFLSVRDEIELMGYNNKAIMKNIRYAVFKEPDFNNELTASAFEPTEETSELLKELPLALINTKKKKGLFC